MKKWNSMSKQARWSVIGGCILILIVLYLSFFIVSETEYVIVTQFGKPIRTIDTAGIQFKFFFQSVQRFNKRLLIYDPRPSEFLTHDKKNILVDSFVCWRIRDPKTFLETVNDITGAELRLHDIVWSQMSATLGHYDLSSLISIEPGIMELDHIMHEISSECRNIARSSYGIEIVDVNMKRLNLPQQNKESVFERMRAERQRIAKQYRAEGEEEALKIRAETDKEKSRILSEAYRESEKIRGDGDAESTRIYSEAYSKDPNFYQLMRTLETYKKILNDKTTIVLSSDSELLKLLTEGRQKIQ